MDFSPSSQSSCQGSPRPRGPPDAGSVTGAPVGSTPASETPWRLVVAGDALTDVISQLLTQVGRGSLPPRGAEIITTVSMETQRLVCSSIPWVRVTEDRQQANCLLLPTAPHQVAESVLADLEQVLGSRGQLERALSTVPHILQHHMVYQVALAIARLVPDQLDASQEDVLRMEAALQSLPPVTMVTVSSDLVGDMLVKLILKLHPLIGHGSSQLDQQQLLALTIQLSLLSLETLRKMPGVAVDTRLPRPGWSMTWLTFLLQSRLMKDFGSALQLKELMATGNPDLLCSIPDHIVEVLLAQYRSRGLDANSIPAPVEVDLMEDRLFSQSLPVSVREGAYHEFGTWVLCCRVFRRAMVPPSTKQVQEYRRSLSQPGFSSRGVVWVRGYLGGNYAEVTSTAGGVALAPNPLALGCTVDALQRHFPQAHLCLTSRGGVKGRPAEADGAPGEVPSEAPGGAGHKGQPSPAGGPLPPGATPLLPATPRESGGGAWLILTTHKVLIPRSFTERIIAELFGEKQQVHLHQAEQVHLHLVQGATKYCKNKVFGRTVRRLKTPEEEVKLAKEVCRPLKEALTSGWLTREGLMEDPEIAVLASYLIAMEVLHHLKPSVRFWEDVKAVDSPCCSNLPVRQESREMAEAGSAPGEVPSEALGGAGHTGQQSPAGGPLLPGATPLLPVTPLESGGGSRPILTTDKVLIMRSFAARIMAELIGEMELGEQVHLHLVQQVHLHLVQGATKYCDNQVFGCNLERLKTPEEEVKLAKEVCRPLKEALPSGWLTREGLMEDPQIAVLACYFVATKVLHHLDHLDQLDHLDHLDHLDKPEPSVSFREAVEVERPPTLLEEWLHREGQESRETILSSVDEESKEVKKGKKKRKWWSRFWRFFSYTKTTEAPDTSPSSTCV